MYLSLQTVTQEIDIQRLYRYKLRIYSQLCGQTVRRSNRHLSHLSGARGATAEWRLPSRDFRRRSLLTHCSLSARRGRGSYFHAFDIQTHLRRKGELMQANPEIPSERRVYFYYSESPTDFFSERWVHSSQGLTKIQNELIFVLYISSFTEGST